MLIRKNKIEKKFKDSRVSSTLSQYFYIIKIFEIYNKNEYISFDLSNIVFENVIRKNFNDYLL